MTPTRRVAAVLLTLALGASTAACSEGSGGSDTAPPEGSHEADHAGHGAGASAPQETGDDADAAFLEHMIPHHRQALDMVELAATRAEAPVVRALAERIGVTQAPEILVMADWLVDHGRAVPAATTTGSHDDHDDHGEMVGMLTDEQMAALADAEGTEFDELFLAGMIEHHEGAVLMAEEVLAEGRDVLVNELAMDVIATQQVEIDRMAALLG